MVSVHRHPVAAISRACQRLWDCRQRFLLWLVHEDAVYIYKQVAFLIGSMVRRGDLYVKTPCVPSLVPNTPILGTDCSQCFTFVCVFPIQGSCNRSAALFPHTFWSLVICNNTQPLHESPLWTNLNSPSPNLKVGLVTVYTCVFLVGCFSFGGCVFGLSVCPFHSWFMFFMWRCSSLTTTPWGASRKRCWWKCTSLSVSREEENRLIGACSTVSLPLNTVF